MGKNDTSVVYTLVKRSSRCGMDPLTQDRVRRLRLVIPHTRTHQDDMETFIPHEMRLSGVTGQTAKLSPK